MDTTFIGNAGCEVVISGAGLAASLGITRQRVWEEVLRGRCGVGPLTEMDGTAEEALGGQALPLDDGNDGKGSREVRYLRKVLIDALLDAGFVNSAGAGFEFPYLQSRCGIVLGTTLHGMRGAGKFLREGNPDFLRGFLAASVARGAGAGLGLAGPAITTCSACSSSLGAIALAVTLLQSGQLDLIAAGGYDAISEYAFAGFSSLRLVAKGAVRPFARDRDGMKVGEGYGVLILERAVDAHRRGRRNNMARVLAFGESADAHHLTQPHPQGEGAARAIESALRGAGLGPSEIDLIVAHGTATPDNDAGEYAALRQVWGEGLCRVPVVAFKSHLAHTLGGAGAVELILSAMALQSQSVPPCANVKEGDWDYPGLNLVTDSARKAPLATTLNLSLGFGGANTCVILGGADSKSSIGDSDTAAVIHAGDLPADDAPTFSRARDVLITGIGVVLPGAVGNEEFVARLLGAGERISADTPEIDESRIAGYLSARRLRRISGYAKFSLAAAMMALQDAGVDDMPSFGASACALLGSTHGSSPYCRDYYEHIVREGMSAANPMLFAEGVPNAAAAHLSLAIGIKGACQTIIGSRTAGLDALGLAAARISTGQWERAIVGAGEEYCDVVNAAYGHCGVYAPRQAALPFEGAGKSSAGGGRRTFAMGCGAVALVLESRAAVETRAGGLARVRGSVEQYASASPGENEQMESAARLLAQLGNPAAIMSSANGTWLDRIEAGAIRISSRAARRQAAVSSLCGHTAECFSVVPLAGLAAVVLTGKLPPLFGPGLPPEAEVGITPPINNLAVLATDYSGVMSGASVRLNRERLAV
ncbi:MAG: beta-ketoacyl-[acyl-carrier-protein] synthase family protein [Planctomycetota bacterium]|nr:beta-ketoacyl-[acyl-carrier-protein] synthase family protein [Planctomycetota bacterium]